MCGAAFRGSPVSEQACGHAAKRVIPRLHQRPPRRTGAARSRRKHDGRPGTAHFVVDALK